MVVYLILYGAGMLFASSAHYYMSGASLILAALYLYFYDYRRTKNPLHLRALFSLFWTGGEGISCLKLSRLQTAWEWETWACFFVAMAAFWNVFAVAERWGVGKTAPGKAADGAAAGSADGRGTRLGLFSAILILTAVSLVAFLLEAAVLGYVPFFLRGVPHAYSYFHISGVHYFTVSCVLVPSMAVIYFFAPWRRKIERPQKKEIVITGIAVLISLGIPVLCVSRFQLIFAVILAVLTYMQVTGQRRLRYLFAAALALVPLYVILTIARSHDVTYLNGIFEMKNENTPIFITQPYMYIANNYDNFNCLVKELPRFALGVKGLFPLWALTGLKFIKPELAAYPIYTTKEELTTVTLFYDAYYDFGIVGVFLFAAALGLFAAWLMERAGRPGNPFWQLFYSQTAMYFMLSFFTTWYSNPATWFYFAATGAMAVYVEIIKLLTRRYSRPMDGTGAGNLDDTQ